MRLDVDFYGCVTVLIIVIFPIFLVYKQVTVWGPEEKARAAAEAQKAAVIAEAKRVEVVNKAAPTAEAAKKRFTAEFHGEFFGGYNNNVRQIFLITDTQTGAQYLSITGCGVTELITEQYQVRQDKKMVTKTRVVEE